VAVIASWVAARSQSHSDLIPYGDAESLLTALRRFRVGPAKPYVSDVEALRVFLDTTAMMAANSASHITKAHTCQDAK